MIIRDKNLIPYRQPRSHQAKNLLVEITRRQQLLLRNEAMEASIN
jgi:hypothetical protein